MSSIVRLTMSRAVLLMLVAWISCGGFAFCTRGAELDRLNKAHPRLVITWRQWEELRSTKDPERRALVEGTVADARRILDQPNAEPVKIGRRLLSYSRKVRDRVLRLAFAYRITGERVFLERAEKEMLAAAALQSWNPSHFLDTAELSCALGFGYDWLYDGLSQKSRQAIRAAIVKNGLMEGLQAGEKGRGWAGAHTNWNQVCLGGLTVGALAVAEEEPAVAERVLAMARRNNVNGLKPYEPDGVYPEGPGYWGYGTSYQVLMIESLRSALGTDWGLPKSTGFMDSVRFLKHATGPSGRVFNFADGAAKPPDPETPYWFARELRDPGVVSELAASTRASLVSKARRTGSPFLALWWTGERGKPEPLFWAGRGHNPVAMWRSAWGDPNACYFAIKAGGSGVNHGHMDGGSFVLERDGVRWAIDLGSQSYESIESLKMGLWDMRQTGDRWKIFRIGCQSHNTLVIGGALHKASGLATLVRADAKGAVIDLTPIYLGPVKRVTREVTWLGKGVELRDVVQGVPPGTTVRWAMSTDAAVTIQKSGAVLEKGGKRFVIMFEAAPGSVVRVESAEHPAGDFNASNPGCKQVILEGRAGADGGFAVRAKLGV